MKINPDETNDKQLQWNPEEDQGQRTEALNGLKLKLPYTIVSRIGEKNADVLDEMVPKVTERLVQ